MKPKCALIFFLLLLILPFRASGITVDEEKKYGKQMYMEIARSVPVNNDVYISFYLRAVRQRIEAVTSLDFPIIFTVIDSPTVDAFASVGGYVFITTGLIALCEREEELAGVLAHEFAHISKRHVAKLMEKQKYMNWSTLATLVAAALIPGAAAKSSVLVAGMASTQQMAITYTREHEEEADKVGAENADKAGYGGLGTAEFLKKLRQTSDNRMVPRYLLTHPNHAERIMKIEQDWRGSKVTINTSFFPYLVVRAQVMHLTIGEDAEEVWINRYLKDKTDPVNAYAAALVYSQKGNVDESIRIAGEINSPYRDLFLGEILVNARRFKEAAAVLRDESRPIGRYFLGRAYEGNGDRSMAVMTYKSVLSYADTYPELFNRIGMLSGMMGSEGEGYEYLGRYYLITGNVELARSNFEKSVNKYGINTRQAREVMKLLDRLPKK